nr:family 16 glycosylhydrolase [Pseudofrankia sp. DC12]
MLAGCGLSHSGPSTPRPSGPSERWVAGSVGITDSRGTFWQPDVSVARGGQVATAGSGAAGTGNPALYRKARVDGSGYELPVVKPGTYAVVLHLLAPRDAGVGQNMFDVTVGGQTVVSALDVAARVGAGHALAVLVPVTVTGEVVDLGFRPRRGEVSVSAVSVTLDSAATIRGTFTDDFAGPAGATVDSRWTFETGGGGWGNNELGVYTSSNKNVALDGAGNLVITARREDIRDADGKTGHYTSGRLTTKNSLDLQYGHVETRLVLPTGGGLLPAFWAVGSNVDSVGWPVSGEIDILELPAPNGSIYASVHGPAQGDAAYARVAGIHRLPAATVAGFHTYSMDWYPGILQFSVDGTVYGSVSVDDMPPGQTWAFDHPFYLIFNLAVGGNWPGSPPAGTRFPQKMVIDYVQVTGHN